MTEWYPLTMDPARRGFDILIGTGGVGSGSFFVLEGNHTLGREESRAGRFLGCRDYCKLHIISHYVKVLLGRDFITLPASRVGDDETGRHLLSEMDEIGLDLRYMERVKGEPTLFSFCFLYPDGSGGNLTTAEAATATVDPEFISRLEPEFQRWQGRGIALAAPEVTLPARSRLLELGSMYNFLRVASLTSEEARSEAALPLIKNTDLLALNLDEAVALAGIPYKTHPPEEVLQPVLERVKLLHPAIFLSITAGRLGSWCWDGSAFVHTPILPVEVAGTAGAGDAHLSGVIAGLVAGLTLPQAHQLASLVAAASVTSPDTIHKGLDRRLLNKLAMANPFDLAPEVRRLL